MRAAELLRRLVFVIASLLPGLAPCEVRSETPDGVALTWNQGRAVLPASLSATRTMAIQDLPLDRISARGLPAILFIHGSDGISQSLLDVARSYSDAGFAVFLPDSYKRPGRVSNCDPKTTICNRWPDTYRHREEEITYAAGALTRLPFVDPAHVVLIGHSEGGIAVAHHAGNFFAGAVISGWHCGPSTRGRDKYLGDFAGIKAAPNVPVLTIYSQRDPWYVAGGGLNGDCSRYFAGRTNARAILEPGDVHYFLYRPDILRAVIDFARSVTRD